MRVRVFGALCALLLTAATSADAPYRYAIDPGSSNIVARVAYFGVSAKTAEFPRIEGTVRINPARPETAAIDVAVDARALTSPDSFILDNLKGQKFFWVERYPTVTFAGQGIALNSPTTGTVTGTITARGVSRPMTLTVLLSEPLNASAPLRAIDLVGKGTIDRRDFGMTAFPVVVGNKVELTINAHLVAN